MATSRKVRKHSEAGVSWSMNPGFDKTLIGSLAYAELAGDTPLKYGQKEHWTNARDKPGSKHYETDAFYSLEGLRRIRRRHLNTLSTL